MTSKANSANYLFQVKPTLPAITMLAAESMTGTQGQLFALLEGNLIPIDRYDKNPNAYNKHIYECLGQGEVIGYQFPDGSFSSELSRFLKKKENEKYRVWFKSDE